MTSTIKSLKEETVKQEISVSNLLRKAKVIASELELSDFLKWIDFELNGYGKESVPEYRVIKGDPRAYNPFNGWIPFVHADPEVQDMFATKGVGQSIGTLEELVKVDHKKFIMKYPTEMEAKMRKSINFDTEINLHIDKSQIVGVIEAVRNTLLDWLIKLDKAGIQGSNDKFTEIEIKEAKKIEPDIKIGNIENFHGNIGNSGNQVENPGVIIGQPETFWTKFFWYVIVALLVVIIGNIASSLILEYTFGFS